jgi:hypothetical protein
MALCKIDIRGVSKVLLTRNMEKVDRIFISGSKITTLGKKPSRTPDTPHLDINRLGQDFVPVSRAYKTQKNACMDYLSSTSSLVSWKPSSGTLQFEQADSGVVSNFDIYYCMLGHGEKLREIKCFSDHLICRIASDRYALVEL